MAVYSIVTPDGSTLVRKNKRGMTHVILHRSRGVWSPLSWHRTKSAAESYKGWLRGNIYTDHYMSDNLIVTETKAD